MTATDDRCDQVPYHARWRLCADHGPPDYVVPVAVEYHNPWDWACVRPSLVERSKRERCFICRPVAECSRPCCASSGEQPTSDNEKGQV